MPRQRLQSSNVSSQFLNMVLYKDKAECLQGLGLLQSHALWHLDACRPRMVSQHMLRQPLQTSATCNAQALEIMHHRDAVHVVQCRIQ